MNITDAGLILAVLVSLGHAYRAQRAAERQVSALLDRIGAEPRLTIHPVAATPAPTKERTYITDDPVDDEAWNDYTGEPADEDTD